MALEDDVLAAFSSCFELARENKPLPVAVEYQSARNITNLILLKAEALPSIIMDASIVTVLTANTCDQKACKDERRSRLC